MCTKNLWELTCSSRGLAAASGWAINPKFNTKNGSQKEAELWNSSSHCSKRRCLFGLIMITHFDQALKNKWYHFQRANYWNHKGSACPAFFLIKRQAACRKSDSLWSLLWLSVLYSLIQMHPVGYSDLIKRAKQWSQFQWGFKESSHYARISIVFHIRIIGGDL